MKNLKASQPAQQDSVSKLKPNQFLKKDEKNKATKQTMALLPYHDPDSEHRLPPLTVKNQHTNPKPVFYYVSKKSDLWTPVGQESQSAICLPT